MIMPNNRCPRDSDVPKKTNSFVLKYGLSRCFSPLLKYDVIIHKRPRSRTTGLKHQSTQKEMMTGVKTKKRDSTPTHHPWGGVSPILSLLAGRCLGRDSLLHPPVSAWTLCLFRPAHQRPLVSSDLCPCKRKVQAGPGHAN